MSERSVARARAGVGQIALPVVAVVFAVATIAGVGLQRDGVTRLAQLSPALLIIDLLAGLAITVSGSLAWVAGRRTLGLAQILAAAGWFGSDWAGYPDAPGVIRAAGIVAAAITLPMLAWAVVATWPIWATRRVRLALAVATASLATLASIWVVAWIPELDPRCLAICDTSPIGAGVDFHLARSLSNVWQGITVVLGSALVAASGLAYERISQAERRRRWQVLAAAAVVGVAWAAWGVILLLPSTVVAPAGSVAIFVFAGRGSALIAMAAALAWWTFRSRETLQAVRALADSLDPFPGSGSLATGLANAYSDPGLRLAYASPDGGFVDGDGWTVEPWGEKPSDGFTTEIRRGGDLLAIVVHSAASTGEAIGTDLSPAVSLAADNERLLASVRHEVLELRASRARIVETGDAERRRLERALHDGAQQRMLGIVHDLAVAQDVAAEVGHPRATVLADMVATADKTIDALRALARGIYPALLGEAGLSAALETFADDAPIPVSLGPMQDERHDSAVEATIWRVVTDAVGEAARAGATAARISIDEIEGRLIATVDVDTSSLAFDAVALADVVGAVGGDLDISNRDGVLRVRADLPCG